jgi:hypothetical protein
MAPLQVAMTWRQRGGTARKILGMGDEVILAWCSTMRRGRGRRGAVVLYERTETSTESQRIETVIGAEEGGGIEILAAREGTGIKRDGETETTTGGVGGTGTMSETGTGTEGVEEDTELLDCELAGMALGAKR